jgi:hypothetical protein
MRAIGGLCKTIKGRFGFIQTHIQSLFWSTSKAGAVVNKGRNHLEGQVGAFALVAFRDLRNAPRN